MKGMSIAVATALACLITTSSADAAEKRSQQAISEFKHEHPCPSTGKSTGACPGYTIDHVTPLGCGGADAPSNTQWQTNEAAKAKDQWEREGCNIYKPAPSYTPPWYSSDPYCNSRCQAAKKGWETRRQRYGPSGRKH